MKKVLKEVEEDMEFAIKMMGTIKDDIEKIENRSKGKKK